MTKFEIKSRWTGAVMFAAEIDCAESEPDSLKLGLAVKWAIKTGANLDGANLDGAYLARASLARASLARANLDGANLTGANLDGAYLAGANLDGAYLDGANLTRANLTGANLDGAYLAGAKVMRKVAQVRRDDGYEFIAFALDDGRLFIRAGCRSMTLADYRAHVAASYPDTPKATETLAILDFIEARAA